MKENNEKNKDEKEKNRRAEIVTRESLGAVGVVFSVLALLILFTRSLIFGEIGVTIDYFLLGMFGYCAYPLFLALLYLSVTSVIGKRFIRNRKAAAAIATSVVFLMLILHIALTYKWELSGYISACFKAGKDGIGTATAAGWTGAIFVYPLVKLTTRIGALIIFSALFLLGAYLSVCFVTGGGLWLRSKKEKKSPVKSETQAKASAPVSFGEAGYPYGADRILPRTNEPSGQSHERISVSANAADGRGGAYMQQPAAPYGAPYAPAPEVRQRPGVMLSGGDYAAGNGRVSPAEPSNAFSPFATFSSPAVRSEPGIPASTENPAGYREYRQSKEFLFGSSPAEIYRKNLIFDSNANVNKKPPVDPDQPTVYDGTFAGSYSAAYAESVNGGDEPARPAKILTDNVRGQDLYAPPYTLRDGGPEPGFGNAATFIPPVSPTVAPVPPFPAEPVPPVRTEPVQTPSVHISTPEADVGGESFRGAEPVFPTSPKEEEKDGRGMSSVFGEERKETPPAPAERTRPGFFDIFSPSNPNIYGNGGGADEAQPETLSGGREDFGRISERGNSDVFGRSDKRDELSPFDDRARETEERPLGSKRDIFDDEDDKEDPYSLRSDFSEQRGGMPAEGDPSGAGDVPFGRSSRMDSPRIEDPRMKPSRMDGERNAERRSEAFVEPPCPVPPPAPKPRPRVHKPYRPAPLDYFDCRDVEPDSNAEEVENNKHTILETLDAFKVTDATIASVTYGPTVTRYNVVIPRNISAKKVVSLDQEIAMSLYAAKGVNIYPNFEDGAVSIEVPNKNRQFVQLGCMLTGDGFTKSKSTSLVYAMGKDVGNRKVYGDICKMTHLLVAGASGSGKSVFLRSLIISLIVKYSPDELRLILIDPKKTEFVIYDHLPHLMINEIITDINKVIQSLNWAIGEMNRRYGLFEQMSRSGTYVVNIDEYNANVAAGEEKLPKIVIIVDELADLMLAAKKEVEDRIQNLTQKSRAAGIHLIIATQRPSADVITGVIKGNLPTRIAFSVASEVDSRVILDASGAQKLLGYGDLLYIMAGMNTPTRVQGASISSEDAQKVVNFIKANNEAEYDESASAFINNTKVQGDETEESEDEGVEEVYIEALRYIIQSGSASISMIQRKCSVGYNKAGKIIEWMEDMGYISAFDGAKARKVLITKEEFESKYGPL